MASIFGHVMLLLVSAVLVSGTYKCPDFDGLTEKNSRIIFLTVKSVCDDVPLGDFFIKQRCFRQANTLIPFEHVVGSVYKYQAPVDRHTIRVNQVGLARIETLVEAGTENEILATMALKCAGTP